MGRFHPEERCVLRSIATTLSDAHASPRLRNCRWEHIIVNDGSADETGDIARELSADPRVVRCSCANGGLGAALTTGIRLARGEFIAFLDADDEYLPGHLSLR